MIRGFYTARTGMMAHQERMNILANNLANVSTVAYKPIKASFTDLMYQNLNREAAGEKTSEVGHGAKINKTDISIRVGALQPTNRAFDFALIKEGDYFAVQSGEDRISYTRAGNFSLSNDDGVFYLVNAEGLRVLDADGSEIEVEFDSQTGEMDFDPELIGVFHFANPYGLVAAGGNLYEATDISGEPEAVEEPIFKSGFLESSGVEIAEEMVTMIEASRAFGFDSKMIQVADEIEQTINSLR